MLLYLTSLLSVTKVTEDIRMVFDGTVSVINNYLRAPNFILPSMGIFIMMVVPETHMVNLDVG